MKSLLPWKRHGRDAAPAVSVDDWFDRVPGTPFRGLFPSFSKSFSSRIPSVEVLEDKHEVVVRAELPGMNEKDIELTWQDGVLRICGEKKSEKEENSKDRFYSEREYGYFSREIPLGDAVEWKTAKAKYRNGVLSVKFPKCERARKSVEIKVT